MSKLFLGLLLALVGHVDGISLAAANRAVMKAYLSSQSHALAREWLKAHDNQAPEGEELDQLKKADPNSYAIVQALLAKQKMGLLNMKRPSTSSSDDASDSMAAAPVLQSHNWLSWKPQSDGDVVTSVMGNSGQVAEATPEAEPAPTPVEAEPAPTPVQETPAVSDAPPAPTVAQESDSEAALARVAGLMSSQSQVHQTTQTSAAEQATESDTNMDLSFGAYQSAATQETKSSFDQHAASIQQGLGKMEQDAEEANSALDSGGPLGVDMNWGGDAADSSSAQAAKPKAQTGDSNSYLNQYPLSMSQENSSPVKRNPAEILGSWLQRNPAGPRHNGNSGAWLQTSKQGNLYGLRGSNSYADMLA